MKCYADLHVHSKYSRATSPKMGLEGLELGAKTKGINLIGTGDFTHPAYFKELKKKLIEVNGFYRLKKSDTNIKFCLSTEISCIYTKKGKGRRIHLIVLVESLKDAEKINKKITKAGGNLKSDGRPMLGIDAEVLVGLIFECSPSAIIIPAHIWTPWYALFGANAGFDSLEECFGKYADKILAIETGISSDPQMNWRVKELDTRSIVSFSDSHSLPKLGRECTVFELEKFDFSSLSNALHSQLPTRSSISYTIEFYPEEGKYHWSGHRKCGVVLGEVEAKKLNYICPKCGKKLTMGVVDRVSALANRSENYNSKTRPPFKKLVPLEEIIAQSFGFGKTSKKTTIEYEKMLSLFGSEFKILEDIKISEIKKFDARVAGGIEKVRAGNIIIKPGYDGVYGVVSIWDK